MSETNVEEIPVVTGNDENSPAKVSEEKTGTIAKSDRVIRTKQQGCFKICHSQAWGKYLIPSEDPDGLELSSFELGGIQLNPDFPKIPAELWARYIGLCFYMCPSGTKLTRSQHDSQLEVQVCLLRDQETLSKWKIVVPKQMVSGVSVKAELKSNIDIVTGERYEQFPPPGWVHAGSSHSHNTMDAFFSGTDDRSELNVPGMHIVVGNIDHDNMQYSYKASIVLQKLRKEVDLDKVVDSTPLELEFHPDVLDYIDTVVSANRKMYARLLEKKEEKEKLKTKTTEEAKGKTANDEKEYHFSEMPFFDESGKPTSFLYGLDRFNSDIFDSEDDNPFYNEDIALAVDEWLENGLHPELIRRSVESVLGGWNEIIQDLDDQESSVKFKHVFLIGVGGTGSHLVGPLTQLMRFHPEGTNDITLIDGDAYEDSNATRQVFDETGLGENKARATAKRLNLENLKTIAQFVDKDKFAQILSQTVKPEDSILVITAVDNHATRNAVIQALDEGDYQNFVMVSPGNAYDRGQVVLYIKEGGELQTAHPFKKYADIANPEDHIPGGEGCARQVASTPQLITANMGAAWGTLIMISNMLDEKGWFEEIHFDCRKAKLVPQGTLKGVLQ